MQNSTTPILDSVIADQKWNPFDFNCREVFAERDARQMRHADWLDATLRMITNASPKTLKKHRTDSSTK